MDRETRFEAIAVADPKAVVRLADDVLATLTVEITRGPTVGLLMVRHEEPVENLTFNLVEVTVTEAEVIAGGARGYAMVMGRNPEHALAGAIIDVAVEINHELAPTASEFLEAARAEENAQWLREWSEVAPTRVKFEESI